MTARKRWQPRGRLQMVIAFIAGMALTALLAQTPAIADILSPQPIKEPAVPAVPGADLDNRQSAIIELVYLPGIPAARPC